MRLGLLFSVLFIWVLLPVSGDSQMYLQLERANSIKVIKFAPGDKIFFRTSKFGDSWQQGNIYRILPEENALVFDDRITYLKDITHFKYYRAWPNGIGTNLMRFGAAWFVFAGIIEGGRSLGVLDTNYKFGTDTAIVGGTALLTGFLTKKIWATAIKKMNDKNRLRIIDLNP